MLDDYSDHSYLEILKKTLDFSKRRDYKGYDKADGMSSKILKSIPIQNKWLNLVFQECAKRAPINIRPLLRVEKRRNPKGIALFTMSNFKTYKLTNNEDFLDESEKLAKWLIKTRNKNYNGFSQGHNHDVQTLNKKITPKESGVVATSYGVKAFLEINKYTPELDCKNIAYSASKFLFNDLEYEETKKGARIKYKPTSSDKSYTLNANALGARLLIDLYSEFSEDRFKESSMKILDYVVSNQTKDGGWMYTYPPSASHLSMDNYHNGFIIESILRYQEVTGSNRFEKELDKALKFYRDVLYNENGSPNWDEKNEYPKDIHSVAQGIITFTMAGDMDFAKKILDWTIANLYAGEGRFYYQKRRFYTKKFTLMRWCQAWMAYAISEYLIK